jgi:hypothetical protein
LLQIFFSPLGAFWGAGRASDSANKRAVTSIRELKSDMAWVVEAEYGLVKVVGDGPVYDVSDFPKRA